MLRILGALVIFACASACNLQADAELGVFGDSVSWGYGNLPGGWVRRIEDRSGYKITNLAVPGERADGAPGRIGPALRSAPGMDTLLLLHGGNDWVKAFRGSQCNQTCDPADVDNKYQAIQHYLEEIAGTAHDRGVRVVFLTYWPSSPGACKRYTPAIFENYMRHRLRTNAAIKAAAAVYGDAVVDSGDMTEIGETADFFDCLHPSAQGYDKIATRIMQGVAAWRPRERTTGDIFKVK